MVCQHRRDPKSNEEVGRRCGEDDDDADEEVEGDVEKILYVGVGDAACAAG